MLVEAEVWPNWIFCAARAGVPVQMVNARLSPRSEKRLRAFRAFVAPVFGLLDRVCVQDEDDAGRYASIGVEAARIVVTGSIKFDEEGGPARCRGWPACGRFVPVSARCWARGSSSRPAPIRARNGWWPSLA